MKKFMSPVVCLLGVLSSAAMAFSQAGHLDSSFGNAGTVETSFGTGNTFALSGAALAPNGNIIAFGTATVSSTSSDSSVLVQYLPSGEPDSAFGSGGILTLPAPASLPGAESLAFGVAVQPNGQILAVSDAFNLSGAEQEVLYRLNANGQPDPGFGTAGQVDINIPVPADYSAAGGDRVDRAKWRHRSRRICRVLSAQKRTTAVDRPGPLSSHGRRG
jgi:uncharacterized delta-60 repeat protein